MPAMKNLRSFFCLAWLALNAAFSIMKYVQLLYGKFQSIFVSL